MLSIIAMRRSVLWILILLSLVACSAQATPSSFSNASKKQTILGTGQIKTPTQVLLKQKPLPPTASPTQNLDQDVAQSYHTVLMLERADDLMIAYVQRAQAGETKFGDSAVMDPYLQAFTVALDDYNQTMPPQLSILNHAWKTVSNVTQQFVNVYSALINGQAISTRDLSSMRMMRQLLKNYQDYAEVYLKQRGYGTDFFTGQHQSVEAHLQKAYSGTPVPTLDVALPPADRKPTPGP